LTPNKSNEGWINPPEEQAGLQLYVETLRERAKLVIGVALITTLIAVAYVVLATKIYQAEADLLVTPVSSSDTTLGSLGLIQESADPTRDVETIARLVHSPEVAARVVADLKLPETPAALLEEVSAQPVAQSDLVAVTASDPSPEQAKAVANSFGRAFVAERTERLHEQIDKTLPDLEAQLAQNATQELSATVAKLQLLSSADDPTVRLDTPATTPTAPTSPKKALSIIGGILAGLILGIVAAFGAQALDQRLRREAQLRRRYQLPVLARIPRDVSHQSGEGPLGPQSLAPVTSEAYRTLRAGLMSPGHEGGRVILITGSSPGEGKTTTALNLATSFANAGRRVILIESDLRRPALGRTVNLSPEHGGVVSVLIENTTLHDALVPSPTYGPMLRVLMADYEGDWISELFSIPAASEMIRSAREMADFVIIDSPPLNEVVDALPLAQYADDVVIVTRLGTTRLDKLSQLAELLAENAIKPRGFAVVGQAPPTRGEYHYAKTDDQRRKPKRGRRQRSAESPGAVPRA
jgi:capsular exopolysaccharide synthesis family protein